MPLRRALACLLFVLLICSFAGFGQGKSGSVDIPYKKFVLDNGLTVLIHEDHKAPIVAVNVWYHVGSKDEKPGKTGFAHLFEHLMFSGSEHHDEVYLGVLEKAGATDLNGTTNEDRTNYFENVPMSAFDLALWMESDRMGHLLGVLGQKKVDLQRGVVQNEKRQGENEPYAVSEELIAKNSFPAGHPYSWTVIGSMTDLDAASLNDVHEWFTTYYGAANTVVVVAGDVETEAAIKKIRHYFGDVPPGPPIAKQQVWIAKRTGSHREVVQDRVPQSRMYKVWNVPQWGSADADYLNIVATILSAGKSSRLYKRLVYDDQTATNAFAWNDAREIAGLFSIEVTAKPGGDLAAVERAADEELNRFLKDGPTDAEMRRAKMNYRSRVIRGLERIGGFGGKSDVLARGQVFAGNPDTYKVSLDRVAAATREDLVKCAREWLSDGAYVLDVVPFPGYQASKDTADRSKVPVPGQPPDAVFPTLQHATLANGLKIILAERRSIPVVRATLLVSAGFAADQFAAPGTANLAMAMLDEGTKTRTALQISDELATLGAQLYAGSDLDACVVSLSSLKENLEASLGIFADVILNPVFPQSDFLRVQKQTLAQIEQEKASPFPMALRVLPILIYGKGHAYGTQFTGTGTASSVSQLKREDLSKFHSTWFKPNNATLIVVGATTMDGMKPKLEKIFAGWQQGEIPQKNISNVPLPSSQQMYMIDKPGALQSIIFAGEVAPPKSDNASIAMETMNEVLGGSFSSRINMNLRENKHWSYGAGSALIGTQAQQLLIGYAPVQTDKTKESTMELMKEFHGIIGDRPSTVDELRQAQNIETLTLAGRWETMGAVGGSIQELVRYNLPDDYPSKYASRVNALTVADLSAAAVKTVKPDNMVWVIVGDRTKIEQSVKELNIGEIHFIDSDGNPLK